MAARSLKILLAEDEPLNAMALQAQLEAMGHSVVALASNGRTAVELARAMPVDLAILDVRMPVLSGLDAAREIFEYAQIPTVLLTGYAEPELMDRAAQIPVFNYLVKPISMEDLSSAITLAWERYQLWKTDVGDGARQKKRH
jgi:two-component system, response regulator PdtaR